MRNGLVLPANDVTNVVNRSACASIPRCPQETLRRLPAQPFNGEDFKTAVDHLVVFIILDVSDRCASVVDGVSA